MVAPKGPGINVRENYLNKKKINCSWAVYQDYTGQAINKALSLGFAIGGNNLFQTTFENEVYSDLTGERCVLMGLIQGAFKAQYDVLRENGHSPTESYNETVEEALSCLYPLINNKGMDWMYENCSTTAQRGALDWAPKFEKVIKPLIKECYKNVINGTEARITIESNSNTNYRNNLKKELEEINNQEIWKVGKIIRDLRN
jgi:ketol-acid reductoisomerase